MILKAFTNKMEVIFVLFLWAELCERYDKYLIAVSRINQSHWEHREESNKYLQGPQIRAWQKCKEAQFPVHL